MWVLCATASGSVSVYFLVLEYPVFTATSRPSQVTRTARSTLCSTYALVYNMGPKYSWGYQGAHKAHYSVHGHVLRRIAAQCRCMLNMSDILHRGVSVHNTLVQMMQAQAVRLAHSLHLQGGTALR